MFVFGHLGIGHRMLGPWRHRLDRWPLVVGMLLPDLIDKPLYYARLSEFLSSTRTFGHTGLLCLALLAAGFTFRRSSLTALGLGMATHHGLDLALDQLMGGPTSSMWIAWTWPLHGLRFADSYIPSLAVHVERLLNAPVVVAEIVGLALLAWDYARRSSASTLETNHGDS
jgi:hypothetical protein